LPSLEVSSQYKTLTGIETESRYFFKLFYPPSVNAKNITEPPIVDGRLNEKMYDDNPGIEELYIDNKNRPAEEKTFVKIFYDDLNIYVGIKGNEPNPSGISASAYGEIPLVFGDDDFEIYFDIDRDLKTFHRLMVNSKGVILSSSPEGRFTFSFDVSAYVGKDFWSAEFKIPFKELKTLKPEKGAVWGFNVRRHRQQSENPQSDWSKMQTFPPYQPEYFGLLKFN
jgi:hypothetical protein